MVISREGPAVYHEKQRLALCGLHAVNNLLQGPFYTKRDFDDVCEELHDCRVFNRHRSVFGIGNYDVNVITTLLERTQHTVQWHDRRRALMACDLEQKLGILQNVPSQGLLSHFSCFISSGRHWRTFLNMDGVWWNLDSNLPKPQLIGSLLDCVAILNGADSEESHILLVSRNASLESASD